MSSSSVFSLIALLGCVLTVETTLTAPLQDYPTSCDGLDDGYYNLKLINSNEYPIITQKCSNGYTILDYSIDNNLKEYFSSWDNWHLETSGPSNDEHVNWRQWYLPDSYKTKHKYLISRDCSTCERAAKNQLYDTLTAYYMTGTLYGCFWWIKGQHNCDINYDTLDCYTCTGGIREADPVLITENSTRYEYTSTGICPTNIQSAELIVNKVHYDCTSSQSTQQNLKPSIGNSGRFCVCTKPEKSKKQIATPINMKNTINMKTYNLDNLDKLKTRSFNLYQGDFDKGTYRIVRPGTYKIMEDITFDFKAGDITNPQASSAWWPTSDNLDDYPGAGLFKDAYFMGFFAGITIETNDVILDLNGHEIKQSILFYYQQRWFTVIELGTQYFLPGQGLGNFGANPVFPENIVIKNGVIGLSSHHGIHGNNNKNILLQDLVIKNFETHGIQFNGFDTIEMENIEVGPSSTQVYFSGEYAHMRAMLPRLRLVAEEVGDKTIKFYNRQYSQTMSEIADEIQTKMTMVWNYVVNDVMYDKNNKDWLDAKSLFYKESGLPHGGAIYGIFLNTYGASVFTYNLYCKEYSQNIKMNNIKIHDIKHQMTEYIAIVDETSTFDLYINPLTAPFSYDQLFNTEDLSYKGSIITDAYLAMEYFSNNWYYLGAQVVGKTKLLKWARYNDLNAVGLYDDGTLRIGCNYDVMIHSGKGINGLRLDGIQNVEINNLEIYNLEDTTPLGRSECGTNIDGEITNNTARMHFRQTKPMQVGFAGNMVQAIQLNAAKSVKFSNVKVHDVKSSFGQTYGIAIWPENEITLDGDISVYDIHAGTEFTSQVQEENPYITQSNSFPNALPESCAIRLVSSYLSDLSDTEYTSTLKINDDCNTTSYNIFGSTGCVGISYLPTMVGVGTLLNEEGEINDENINNYDIYQNVMELILGDYIFTEDPDIDDVIALTETKNNKNNNSNFFIKFSIKNHRIFHILLYIIGISFICSILFFSLKHYYDNKSSYYGYQRLNTESRYGTV